MSELSNTDSDVAQMLEARRLARRAEFLKLLAPLSPEEKVYWDAQMDEDDRQFDRTLAAMIKAGEEYDAEHPDDPAPAATPEDCRMLTMEEVLADNGFPPVDPITEVPKAKSSPVQARPKGVRTNTPRVARNRRQLKFKDGIDPTKGK